MIRNCLLIAILAALSLPVAYATAIYKWVDKDGVTHFSQDPPPNEVKKVEQLDSASMEPVKIGSVAPTVSKEKSVGTSANGKGLNEQEKAQAEQICEQAQFKLNVLKTHNRLQQKDAKSGDMVQMTEEQRQQEIKTQEQRIKLFCHK